MRGRWRVDRLLPWCHSLQQHYTNVYCVIFVHQIYWPTLSTPLHSLAVLAMQPTPYILTFPQIFQVFGEYAIFQNKMGPLFRYGSFQLASILTWPENSIALTNFGKLIFNKFIPILLIWHSLCSWATTAYIKNLPFSFLGKMPYKKNQYTISFWRKEYDNALCSMTLATNHCQVWNINKSGNVIFHLHDRTN